MWYMTFSSVRDLYMYKICKRERYMWGLSQEFPGTPVCNIEFFELCPQGLFLYLRTFTSMAILKSGPCPPPTHTHTHMFTEPWNREVGHPEEAYQRLSQSPPCPGYQELGHLETGSVSTGTDVQGHEKTAMLQQRWEGQSRGKERERRGKVDVLGSRDERSHVLRETGQQAEINRGQDTDNQQDWWKDRHGTQ